MEPTESKQQDKGAWGKIMQKIPFIKVWLVLTVIGILIASAISLRRVQAQITTIQPFTATQLHETIAGAKHGAVGPRHDITQIPVPYTYTKIIAVRSDGAICIAQAHPKTPKITEEVFMRSILNPKAFTKKSYDPLTGSVIIHDFQVDQSLRGNAFCEGTPDGQIEGFDVVRYNRRVNPLPDGEIITDTSWAAPKLGCFVLKNEIISMHEGQLMFDATTSLHHIRVGEPDPWFFDEDETGLQRRTPQEWAELYKLYQ